MEANGIIYSRIRNKISKYKYRLDRTYSVILPYIAGPEVMTDWFFLKRDGTVCVAQRYCWDGASGPTIDTKSTMRASLLHDVLYQTMREKLIPYSFRPQADEVLRRVMIEDGASRFRAAYYYYAVRLFAGRCAK